jgi:hypothetical protein
MDQIFGVTPSLEKSVFLIAIKRPGVKSWIVRHSAPITFPIPVDTKIVSPYYTRTTPLSRESSCQAGRKPETSFRNVATYAMEKPARI